MSEQDTDPTDVDLVDAPAEDVEVPEEDPVVRMRRERQNRRDEGPIAELIRTKADRRAQAREERQAAEKDWNRRTNEAHRLSTSRHWG